MGATEEHLKEFLYNYEAIKSSGLTPSHLKEAGFSFQDLMASGCSAKNMRQLEGFNIKSIVLAFQPSAQEWLDAGFTDDVVTKAGWDGSLYRRFIANQTSKLAATAEGPMLIGSPVKRSIRRSMSEAKAVLPPCPNDMAKSGLDKVLESSKRLNFQLNINA